MEPTSIDTDYLVVGAGASAMGFVDTLLDESDSEVVIVDRHAQPGGHWNDVYPFVRLHQPSAFYGVNSRALGDGTIDATGLNKGLRELASGAEVLHHFDQVMRQRFLPSGRVRYFPLSEYSGKESGAHHITSLLSEKSKVVNVRKKLVDATLVNTAVPSTSVPRYHLADGVECIPPNGLTKVRHAYPQYVVVGAGKTGMDACTWLLQNDVSPSCIHWIRPRDAWLLDRANIQPDPAFFMQFIGSLKAQFEAMAAASSIPDLFERLEETGQLLRIDKSVAPTMYHCATVSQAELAELRRIHNVVRLGHVKAIEQGWIKLDNGSISIDPHALIVDCSTYGVSSFPDLPVFDNDQINIMMVRTCQPAFSAAMIGFVESHFIDEAEKNTLCRVVPMPMVPVDWLRMWAIFLSNRQRWGQYQNLMSWISRSRLDGISAIVNSIGDGETEKQALLQQYRKSIGPGAENLLKLLAHLR